LQAIVQSQLPGVYIISQHLSDDERFASPRLQLYSARQQDQAIAGLYRKRTEIWSQHRETV